MKIEELKIAETLLSIAKELERYVDFGIRSMHYTYEKVAEILNETIAPELSKKFDVDCRFEARIEPDITFPELKLYVILKKVFDDVEEAYEEENRVWKMIDDYLSKNYDKLYRYFSVIVFPRFREEVDAEEEGDGR